MRTLIRNERQFWYATFAGKTDVLDANGDVAGQKVTYSEPVEFWAVMSPGQGYSGFGGSAYRGYFGIDIDSDRRLVTADLTLPITETTLIWASEPVLLEDGTADPESADYTVAAHPADGKTFLSIPITRRAKNEE